jgi:hypothetical protein
MDGSIAVWGDDNYGQVSSAPSELGFTQITAGGGHFLALRDDGSIAAWGRDTEHQVSDTPSGTGFLQVVGGGTHSLALRADGSMVSWGDDNASVVTNTPGGVGFTQVAAGLYSSLALRTDNSIVSWGYDGYGQVSNAPNGGGFTQVAGGLYFMVALRDTSFGTVFCEPVAANSTGVPAVLTGRFNPGVGSGVHLDVADGVPGYLIYFLLGNEPTAPTPISNGWFCLGGTDPFFRYKVAGTPMNSIGYFDASGVMVNASGTSTTGLGFDVPSTIPTANPDAIMAGDTWHFQGWYRDTPAGVGTSKFTNGLSVTF